MLTAFGQRRPLAEEMNFPTGFVGRIQKLNFFVGRSFSK